MKAAAYILLVFLISLQSLLANDKPANIFFIAIDDLRPELSVYGAAVQTPNFDRLARNATVFKQAYCQQAVCGASRLSIMSSLYPRFTGEHTYHITDWRKRHADVVTLNQHFRNNGYQTVGMGKIYHKTGGSGADIDNWDQWLSPKAPVYALKESNDARKKLAATGISTPRGPATEMADVADDFYIDGKRSRATAELLSNLAKSESPFFLAVGFNKPHLPFVAPKKYWDLYQRDQFRMPDNLKIPEGFPVYAANQNPGEIRNYSDVQIPIPDFSVDLQKRLIHGYAACVSYTDANLGIVMDALEENNLSDNTIVVVWGDHGWKLGDHSSWCKHTNFECDTHVPLLIRTPNHSANTCAQPVELIDLYPTLCDLVDLPTPDHCQGKSIVELLESPDTPLSVDFAYSCYPARKSKDSPKEMGHSVRFTDYRYTEWRDLNDSSIVYSKVLTNLKKDPGEQLNFINDPESQEAVAQGVNYIELAISKSNTEKDN